MNEQALISQLKTEMTSKRPLFMQIQQCAAPGGGNNRKSYINLENTHDMAALLPLLLPMHPRNAAAAQLGGECCKIFWKARSSSSCLP